MIPSKREIATPAVDDLSTAADLTYSIRSDLDFARDSFRKAKQNLDQLITETNDAFLKFEELIRLPEIGGGGGAALTDLRVLRQSVSILKSRIPFSLITPYSDSNQSSNEDLHFRPRTFDPKNIERSVRNPTKDLNFQQPPTQLELESSLDALTDESKDCLVCFLCFPGDAIIKKSIVFYWVKSHCSGDFDELINGLIAKGFINRVYKKGNMGVSGYWMHPFVRSTLNDKKLMQWRSFSSYVLRSFNEDDDIIYGDSLQQSFQVGEAKEAKKFLHLGKWQRSSTEYFEQHNEQKFKQHIEVDDPKLFFKDVENLCSLRYVSLGGISMITELPYFITQLKALEVLDLKSCYNLEVIPPGIANLSRSLTHLDMSECYFLDHMPMALASLHSLKVLKGFFVGQTKKKNSCKLHHLGALQDLVKLNIYTSVTEFPNEDQLTILQEFKCLRNLTISWGACSVLGATEISRLAVIAATRHRGFLERKGASAAANKAFSFKLEKLDLQCVPEMVNRSWLNPSNFKELKKLSIRGGLFYDLGQLWENQEIEEPVPTDDSQWKVEILRLKHLSKLEMSWLELECLFPNLKCVEKVRCPRLNGFPCNDNGFFVKETEL